MTKPDYQLLYPRQIVLITSFGRYNGTEKDNISTIAWSMPTSFAPELIAISMNNASLTCELIEETGEFVVNIPSFDMKDKVLLCGTKTGVDIDKFKEAGFTPISAEKVAPKLIKECLANIECSVVDSIKTGDHTLFIGKIIGSRRNNENTGKVLVDLGGRNFVGL